MISSKLLDSLRDDVTSIVSAIKVDIAPLPGEILNWKESPDRWSILECLEHLNKYSLYYNAQLKKVIEQSPQSNDGDIEAKSTWLGRKFAAMMHPDNSSKSRTFSRMNPIHGTLDESVLERFLGHQNELRAIIQKAHGLNLNTRYVPLEFIKLIKMNLGDALQFVVVHELRHMNQAKRVKLIAQKAFMIQASQI